MESFIWYPAANKALNIEVWNILDDVLDIQRLSSLSIVLSTLMTLLGIMLVLVIEKKISRVLNKYVALSITIVFLSYYFAGLLYSKVNFLPYAPDSEVYFLLLQTDAVDSNLALGYKAYYYWMRPIFWFGLNSYIYITCINIVVFIAGILFYYAAITQQTSDHYHPNCEFYLTHRALSVILLLIWASPYWLLILPLREALLMFFLGLFLWCTVSIKRTLRNPLKLVMYLILATTSLVGTISIRYQIIPLIGLLVLAILSNWRITPIIRRNYVRFCVIAVSIFAALHLFNLDYVLDPSEFTARRNYRVENLEGTYGTVLWDSWFDVVASVPEFTIHFLFSPISTSSTPWDQTVFFADAVFILVMFFISVLGLISKDRRHIPNPREHRSKLLIFVIASMLFAVYEYHVGGAARHRFIIVPILIPLASASLGALLFSKDKRRRPLGRDESNHFDSV
ncbi:hypothetical protein ACFL1S_04475 [Pseudomonadota bacterium]